MERFAIKIDHTVKSNLYNICRLCGIDHPKKVSIIDALTLLGIQESSEDEPDLCKKIFVCVGIKVTKDDQMPQTVCQLCADKINDFFEYREMCSATNTQTRKLLGIPEEQEPPKSVANPLGRKRKNNKSAVQFPSKYEEDEGESILGNTSTDLDMDLDDKKDIILNIPFKGGTKSKYKKTAINPSTSAGGGSGKRGGTTKTGRPSKKKSMADVMEDEIKQEELEVKTEYPDEILPLAVRAGKQQLSLGGIKIKLKKPPGSGKKVAFSNLNDGLPLLKPKEPNKRERRREIDSKKMEKKRKYPADTAVAGEYDHTTKKLKIETPCCIICTQDFSDMNNLTNHLITSHSPTIFEYGCSSCGEFFKSGDEQKDHQLWHSLSNTMYHCAVCSTTYDKLHAYSRHRTHCKQMIEEKMLAIRRFICAICGDEFVTQNLHDWHNCYMKKNGQCMRCKRRFVKKSTLLNHAVKCEAIRIPDDDHLVTTKDIAQQPIQFSTEQVISDKKKKKVKNASTSSVETLIKSEPEASIDDNRMAANETDNLLKKVNELCLQSPSIVLHKLRTDDLELPNTTNADRPNQSLDDKANDKQIDDESNYLEYPDVGHFNDDDAMSSSNESTTENGEQQMLSVNAAAAIRTVTTPPSTSAIKTEPIDDIDDVILLENKTDEPIIIPNETSLIKNTLENPTATKVTRNLGMSIFDPTIKIKEEPTDDLSTTLNCLPNAENLVSTTTAADTATFDVSSVQSTSKQKKSKHNKHKKSKRLPCPPLSASTSRTFQIKQEPLQDYNVSEISVTSNISTVVHTTLNPLPTNISTPISINAIKEEPLRPGYDEYDPKIAANIKQELTDDTLSAVTKQPSLRLKITKNRGTLNAQIIPDCSALTATSLPFVASSNTLLNSETSSPHTSLSNKKSSNTGNVSSTNNTVRPKNLYKKPALLAQKIREEMLARISKNQNTPQQASITTTSISPSSQDELNSVPVISQVASVADGTNIPLNVQAKANQELNQQKIDFSAVRIKTEKPDDYPDQNQRETKQSNQFSAAENTTNIPIDKIGKQKVLNPLAARLQKKISMEKIQCTVENKVQLRQLKESASKSTDEGNTTANSNSGEMTHGIKVHEKINEDSEKVVANDGGIEDTNICSEKSEIEKSRTENFVHSKIINKDENVDVSYTERKEKKMEESNETKEMQEAEKMEEADEMREIKKTEEMKEIEKTEEMEKVEKLEEANEMEQANKYELSKEKKKAEEGEAIEIKEAEKKEALEVLDEEGKADKVDELEEDNHSEEPSEEKDEDVQDVQKEKDVEVQKENEGDKYSDPNSSKSFKIIEEQVQCSKPEAFITNLNEEYLRENCDKMTESTNLPPDYSSGNIIHQSSSKSEHLAASCSSSNNCPFPTNIEQQLQRQLNDDPTNSFHDLKRSIDSIVEQMDTMTQCEANFNGIDGITWGLKHLDESMHLNNYPTQEASTLLVAAAESASVNISYTEYPAELTGNSQCPLNTIPTRATVSANDVSVILPVGSSSEYTEMYRTNSYHTSNCDGGDGGCPSDNNCNNSRTFPSISQLPVMLNVDRSQQPQQQLQQQTLDDMLEKISDDSLDDSLDDLNDNDNDGEDNDDDKQIDWEMENHLLNETENDHATSSTS